MGRLTCSNVFSKYEKSFSHKLSQRTYSVYKKVRLKTAKKFPLKEHEKYWFEDDHFPNHASSDMPKGYDFSAKAEVDGFVEFKYLDFFDYLPKEEIDTFKTKLHRFAMKNGKPMFSFYRTEEDEDCIVSFGRYVDGMAFSNLHTVEFAHNDYLSKYAPQVTISIWNLSSSFLVVKYRFYISKSFNEEIEQIYKAKFEPFSDVSRQFNVHWYKPWKFGRAMFTGDNARRAALYSKVSELKWAAYSEIKRWFKIHFADNGLFPPIFETYSTNIRPNSERERFGFWNSIGLDYNPDYSQTYNACVGWTKDIGSKEGMNLMAFCGGNYIQNDCLPEIAEYDLSDIYSVYMVASSLRRIAERDIAVCNKKISNAIRKARSLKLLKVRSLVERKLYYSYRFMSEFSGNSIEFSNKDAFKNPAVKDGSITERALNEITSSIAETKQQIDSILRLLDDAAEYESSKSNMTLQCFMAVVTLVSLVIAFIASTDFTIDCNTIWEKIKSILLK